MAIKQIVDEMSIVLVSVAALALSGCSVQAVDDEALEEDVAEVAQAMGTECAGAFPTATFVGGYDYTSPRTYNTVNCSNGVVLDVTNYKNGWTPPTNDPYY